MEISPYLIGVLSILIGAGWWIWDGWFRRIPLTDFGVEAVQRVLKWESDSFREMVWARGWMTSHEWIKLNKQQIRAISEELKRRGLE